MRAECTRRIAFSSARWALVLPQVVRQDSAELLELTQAGEEAGAEGQGQSAVGALHREHAAPTRLYLQRQTMLAVEIQRMQRHCDGRLADDAEAGSTEEVDATGAGVTGIGVRVMPVAHLRAVRDVRSLACYLVVTGWIPVWFSGGPEMVF